MNQYAIHWFRRDLRVVGNPALEYAHKKYEGRVLGLFSFDSQFLSRSDFSPNRFQFFLESLKALQKELQSLGGDLIVLDQGPDETWQNLISQLAQKKLSLPNLVTWCRDYEPFARDRDARVEKILKAKNIEIQTFRDHLLIEPHEVCKNNTVDEGYQVFTPFANKWLEVFKTDDVQERITQKKKASFKMSWKDLNLNLRDSLAEFSKKNQKQVSIPIPAAGSVEALASLKKFKKLLGTYDQSRDFPALEGTSKLSIYLKNGSLATSQVIHYLNLQPYHKALKPEAKFFSELIWREFYYHILYRHPRVEKEAFISKYKKIKWSNNEKYFSAWQEGKTGFPIVDAGMRELKETGWMHNRVRMIVASFLTKDLLIDWRWGEEHFMQQLLDGDLAPNNGGWQWAASTGCDPQPYFRIFNPWLQSAKFDPQGEYIKKYLPELKNIESKKLHQPILDLRTYPKPIVDHSVQRDKALLMYKSCD